MSESAQASESVGAIESARVRGRLFFKVGDGGRVSLWISPTNSKYLGNDSVLKLGIKLKLRRKTYHWTYVPRRHPTREHEAHFPRAQGEGGSSGRAGTAGYCKRLAILNSRHCRLECLLLQAQWRLAQSFVLIKYFMCVCVCVVWQCYISI